MSALVLSEAALSSSHLTVGTLRCDNPLSLGLSIVMRWVIRAIESWFSVELVHVLVVVCEILLNQFCLIELN